MHTKTTLLWFLCFLGFCKPHHGKKNLDYTYKINLIELKNHRKKNKIIEQYLS